MMIKRDEALKLLADQGTPVSLLQHALAAEAIMRTLARRFGEDEDMWGLTGLLHDLDYPATAEAPERHGLESATMLTGKLPEEALAAIRAHNGEMNGAAPQCRFDYALRCGETVTGLISAAARMRPQAWKAWSPKASRKR